jgi:hypothetical protein
LPGRVLCISVCPLLVISAVSILTGCVHYEPRWIDPAHEATAIESRSLSDPALKQFLESVTRTPEVLWPRTNCDFDGLTLAAFCFHPDLDIARAAWRRTQAGEITAGARPNPTLSVGPQYKVNAASRVTPWLALANLDVPVETAGKRKHGLEQAIQFPLNIDLARGSRRPLTSQQ